MATFPFPDPRRRRSLLEQLMPQVNPALLEGYAPQGLMDPTPPATAGPTLPQGASRGGFRGALDSLTSGQDDPRLSPEQNAIARKQAMIQSGLAMMAAASQPGARAGGAIAQGLMHGQAAGADARERAYGLTQQERLTQALSDPKILAKLTPEQQRFIRVLPPDQAVAMLAKLAFTPEESTVVGPNSAVLQGGKEVYRNVVEDKVDLGADATNALLGMGLNPADVQSLPPDQAAAFMQQLMALRQAGASRVTTNVNSGTGAAAQAFGQSIATGFDAASRTESLLPRVSRALEITKDPEFKKVTGNFKSSKDILQRFSGNPAARALAQEYDILTGEEGLRILANFTGPKSDKEMAVSWKLASGDRSLTSEELEAGLNVMRRSALFDSSRWADQVLRGGPALVGGDPVMWAEYERRARVIQAAWREELARMVASGLNVSEYSR